MQASTPDVCPEPRKVENPRRERWRYGAAILVGVVTTLMAGCATRGPTPHAQRPKTPAAAETPVAKPPAATPRADSRPEISATTPPALPTPASELPVIVALMEEAEASRVAGDLENAASGLERALRIQPRNPQLWHDLAKIRLQQGEASLAEELARKSSVLAAGDGRLLTANETLIAEARRRQGLGPGDNDPGE